MHLSFLQRVICCTGLALLGCTIPGHASSQDAPRNHQLQSQAQTESSNQPVRRKKPSSTKRTKSPRSSQLLRTLEDLFVPPQGGAPKSTANSATRNHGKCAADEATIRAMVPSQGYGLSSRDRPAITLDLPPTSAQQVALLFRNESGQVDHRAWLPIPPSSKPEASSSGNGLHLTQFQLPTDLPGLEAGQRYRWSLVVVCGDTIGPDDPTFMGWVKYQAPTPQQELLLTNLTPAEQQRWYGERGYWYDMLQP